MRLLIYAMESSGASTFCYFLGQRPGSVAILDVWSSALTPPIETQQPIVAKATVTTTFSAADHIASFRPDRTILFIRHPVAVYASLTKYPYANTFGTVEQKIARFDREFAGGTWDAIIRYEDFVTRAPTLTTRLSALGWQCDASYWDTPRSLADILACNSTASPWLAAQFNKSWGFGNFKEGPITPALAHPPDRPDIAALIAKLSPNLSAAYQIR